MTRMRGKINHWLACFFGANPFFGRLACWLFNLHVCKDPTGLFKDNNPDYFTCCVCHREIEVRQEDQRSSNNGMAI